MGDQSSGVDHGKFRCQVVKPIVTTRPVEFPVGCHNPCHSLIIPLTGFIHKSLLVCHSPLLLMYEYESIFYSPQPLSLTNAARFVVPSI